MKIILTGASGLIGSRFEELLKDKHEIISISSKDLDIASIDSVNHVFSSKEADAVVHLAAKTDVDGCEEDKEKDLELINKNIDDQEEVEKIEWNKSDISDSLSAFIINFYGTKNVYEAAKVRNMKFVYISTDFVFAGNDEYDEESLPKPINWYGMTKYYGERLIDISRDLIVRLSFPYGYENPVKKDFIWKLIDLMKKKVEVDLIEDETITPTFIDDIVLGIEFLLSKNTTGVYHLTGSSFENPYEIGIKIKDKYNLPTSIKTTTRDKLYTGRADRPFKSIMKNAKIKNLGFYPKTFEEGFDLITK